jgi:hypothetical protein
LYLSTFAIQSGDLSIGPKLFCCGSNRLLRLASLFGDEVWRALPLARSHRFPWRGQAKRALPRWKNSGEPLMLIELP